MPFEIRNIILAYLTDAAMCHLPCHLGSVTFVITLFYSLRQLFWISFLFDLKRGKISVFNFVC